MARDLGLFKSVTASEAQLGTSKGGNVMDQGRRLPGLPKKLGVREMSMRLWVAMLVVGGVAVLDDYVASADEGLVKGPILLTYLVTEAERTLAIWGSAVSEEPPENIADNQPLLPVPDGMQEEIKDILFENPGNYPDGTLEYVIVVKGGSSVRICHTQGGEPHCHPPQ